jgi:hypothetical protein
LSSPFIDFLKKSDRISHNVSVVNEAFLRAQKNVVEIKHHKGRQTSAPDWCFAEPEQGGEQLPLVK